MSDYTIVILANMALQTQTCAVVDVMIMSICLSDLRQVQG